MPSHDHCCVPACTSRRDKQPHLSFHSFPKTEPSRAQWIVAVKRDEGPYFRISNSTVVCSEHFTEDDFTLPASSPVGYGRARRRLKSGAVPSVFSFSAKRCKRVSPTERLSTADARLALLSLPKFGPMTALESCDADLRMAKSTVDELERDVARLKAENARLQQQVFRFLNVKEDPERLFFLSGVSSDVWDLLWNFLKPSRETVVSGKSAATEAEGRVNCPGAGRKPTLDLEDELLVTLMRLRLGWLEKALGYMFGITESAVSRIVVKWLNYLYLRLGMIPIWPEWEEIERTMPPAFKEAYPSTIAIIDATELFCEVPSSLSAQSQHYSAYKSHTTLKSLVAIAPNGAFIFVSELFSGSISDRDLYLQSGMDNLLKKMPPGKSLMADRGFEIQDLILKHDLLLNIPPFKGMLPSLTKEDVQKTQRIARLRIHVERAIGQVKARFHVFDKAIPLSSFGVVNQMWTVCCLLSNFFGPLIADTNK